MKRNLLFVVLLGTASGLPACATPLTYSAEPIEAWVVDAETKQPLEGVIVTANWELRGGPSPGGSTPAGQLMVMEAVTDKNGRFHFPAWEPKLRLPLTELHNHDPRLLLFKSGYRYAELANERRYISRPETILEPVRRSDWNGKTIELKPFKGTMEEWAEHVYSLGSDIYYDFARGKDCNWKKIPRILTALHKMSLYFDAQGVKLKGWRLGQHVLRIEDIPRNSICGSVDEFFRSYLQ